MVNNSYHGSTRVSDYEISRTWALNYSGKPYKSITCVAHMSKGADTRQHLLLSAYCVFPDNLVVYARALTSFHAVGDPMSGCPHQKLICDTL